MGAAGGGSVPGAKGDAPMWIPEMVLTWKHATPAWLELEFDKGFLVFSVLFLLASGQCPFPYFLGAINSLPSKPKVR